MSKGWGAPGPIAGARTWVPGPTTPFPALALTSVHLIRPLKLVLNPMLLYLTLAAKWANRQTDRLTGRFALTVHPPELVQPRRKSKQPRVTVRSGSLHDTPTADRHRIKPCRRSPPIRCVHARCALRAANLQSLAETSRFSSLAAWPCPCLHVVYVVQSNGQRGRSPEGRIDRLDWHSR